MTAHQSTFDTEQTTPYAGAECGHPETRLRLPPIAGRFTGAQSATLRLAAGAGVVAPELQN